MSKEKRDIVITGAIVAKIACILAIIAVVVFISASLVRGMSFVEIVTEHWWMWPGLVVAALGLFFPEDKKAKSEGKLSERD